MKAGDRIFVGIGGWTFKPWRGVFYPDGLVQRRELEFASRALTGEMARKDQRTPRNHEEHHEKCRDTEPKRNEHLILLRAAYRGWLPMTVTGPFSTDR